MPKFAVIDCETDPFDGTTNIAPFIWGFFDGAEYQEFDSTEKLVECIMNFSGIVYAHNGGKFDFYFLLDWLEEDQELMIINGRIAKMQLGSAELRDSINIIPVGLAKYKKDEFDYAKMKREVRSKYKVEISRYLRNDCIYLYELIERFIRDYGLHLTQAGAAMSEWKKIAPIDPCRTDKEYYDLFAPWYFGGRVECFEKGIINTNFAVYDINSAYPYAMLEKHPYSKEYIEADKYVKDADFYTVECKSVGAFPFRGRDGSLYFPADGEIRQFHISGWELAAAKETGLIKNIDVQKSIKFMGKMDFSAYIHKFYDLRKKAKQENDAAGVLLYKLIMNSLYGKFGANPDNYANYKVCTGRNVLTNQNLGWNYAGLLGQWNLLESPLDASQQHYYNVATAASITGYVRAMLMRAIHKSKGVLYVDTDSIAVREAKLPLGEELGQWKYEGEFDRAGIAGKKLYIFRGCNGTKNKMASKGVRLDEKQLWDCAKGKIIEWQSLAPTFSVHAAPHVKHRKVKLT